jgi:hypothetical protein
VDIETGAGWYDQIQKALVRAAWWAREELNLRPLPCQEKKPAQRERLAPSISHGDRAERGPTRRLASSSTFRLRDGCSASNWTEQVAWGARSRGVMLRTRGSVHRGRRSGGAGRSSAHSLLRHAPRAPASRGPSSGAADACCRVGPGRGAAFRRARFPGPPSEPGVPVSRHRALHEARYQQTVALTLGSAVPDLDCQVGRRYSPAAPARPTRRRSLAVPLRHVAGFPGPPTTTGTPPRPATNNRRRACPPPEGGRAATGRFPRSPPPGRRGRCPAIPRQPRQGYAAALLPGLLTGHYLPATESLAAIATGVHC